MFRYKILVRKEIIDLGLCGFNMANNEFREELDPQSSVNKVIGIVSGKGGVGKSLVTSLMAVKAMTKGFRVGIIDADITGPSIPKAFGLSGKLGVTYDQLMVPAVTNTGINVVSTNLILENETDPVIWRGPVIAGVVKQFWKDTVWNNIDYMFVDMPLTVFQSIPVDGIIIVTSPQELVSMIVTKAVNMAKKMNVPILGLVENMSYFECPDCGHRHEIFGKSHIDEIAKKEGLKVLAKIPIDPEVAKQVDAGLVEYVQAPWLDEAADSILK